MKGNPVHWRSHYRGTEEECRRLRFYSYRDRIRYYWGHPEVEAALRQLMHNLPDPVPLELIQRFFPEISAQAASIVEGAHPAALIRLRIQKALSPYQDACR
jgi:D-tagatose-1,6-bisphosphate aldolase subunit GatZ/KbaZ